MNSNTISLPAFSKAVFSKAPSAVIGTGLLFWLAGILEFFSLAALLPVLINLLGSSSGAGFAGEIMEGIGLPDLSFTAALVMVLVLMSLRGGVIFLADFWVAKVAQDIELDTRSRLYSSLIHSNWQYLLSQDVGNISNLILREAERYSRAILQLGRFFSSTLIAGILIISSLFVSWQAFLIFACATVPYWLVTKSINKRIQNNAMARVNEANKISSQIGENTPHLKYIKAAGLEDAVERKFAQSVEAYAHYFLKIILYQRFILHFPEVFGVLILGALVLFSYLYMGENPTDIIFFLLLLFRGYRQIAVVQTTLAAILENIPSYTVCEDVIAKASRQREHFEGSKVQHMSPLQIEVKDVGFSYSDKSKSALENATLTIPPRGLIALVGSSGAGKTTLGDILLGLITPQKGEIIINGKTRLADINLLLWRRNTGYVSQDVFLVSGTIRQNILLGAEDQSDENLENTARQACIDHYITNLPEGYETEVGMLGIRLSGGQKQRIALARALARKPDFLILDEATSALDSKTENEVQETISQIAKTIPVVVIAHRLSTIRNADQIFVLDTGRVVEWGTFDSLLKQKGPFRSLYEAAEGS